MFTRVIIRSSKNNSLLSPIIRFNPFSTTVSPEPKNIGADSDIEENVGKINNFRRSGIVAAAFASLQKESVSNTIKTPSTDNKLQKAQSVNELLSVSEGSGVSRRHALKVVSILSDWTNEGKIELKDFENDPRFLRLCRILTKALPSQKIEKFNETTTSEDLSLVLSVTADDEAAKLIGGITVPQMVKVMKTLSMRKRRSLLLLRTIAYNITGSAHELNLKESSDLLYTMAVLNFPDENLLSKIGNDICKEAQKHRDKSSVIGSILTSIGLLKYHNPDLLDALSDWVMKNHSICRQQDAFSLCMTLAVVNYKPTNVDQLFKNLAPYFKQMDSSKFTLWLEIIWSLVLLNQANNVQVGSIFTEKFLEKFEENSPLPLKLKLLNIDGAAQYFMKDYTGPRLPPTSCIRNIEPPVSKDKTEMVTSVKDTFMNLIQSDGLLKRNVNTGLGFYIDIELLLDNKGNPVPFDKMKDQPDLTRVAVLVQHYHDMTLGKVVPSGINDFCEKLLNAQGYKILTVPYTEFKPRDNLLHRVKYIETKLKNIVKS